MRIYNLCSSFEQSSTSLTSKKICPICKITNSTQCLILERNSWTKQIIYSSSLHLHSLARLGWHLPALAGPEIGAHQQARQSPPPVSQSTARLSQAGFRELAFLSLPYNLTGINQPNFCLRKLTYIFRSKTHFAHLWYGSSQTHAFWPQKIVWTFRLFIHNIPIHSSYHL